MKPEPIKRNPDPAPNNGKILIVGGYGQVGRLIAERLARQNGVCALLSVGVVPGLTNMLAARVQENMDQVDRIDILIEFGLGDRYGRAAVERMFDNLDSEYEVKENGQPKPVHSFGDSINIALPGQPVSRPACRFNFPDQHVIGRTTDVPAVSTWVRFDDRFSTWVFAKSSTAGLGRLLRRRWWRKAAVWLFMNVHMGSDICAVAARATGQTRDGRQSLTFGLIGRGEALMTAIVAAESARQVLSGNSGPGVRHAGQTIALDPVVGALNHDLPDLVEALAT